MTENKADETITLELTKDQCIALSNSKDPKLVQIALLALGKDELINELKLPQTFDEAINSFIKRNVTYYISDDCDIIPFRCYDYVNSEYCKNTLPSIKDCEKHLALMQLHLLRDIYRKGWIPNKHNYKEDKYSIFKDTSDTYVIIHNNELSPFLSFPTRQIAEMFLNNFKYLIELVTDIIY